MDPGNSPSAKNPLDGGLIGGPAEPELDGGQHHVVSPSTAMDHLMANPDSDVSIFNCFE